MNTRHHSRSGATLAALVLGLAWAGSVWAHVFPRTQVPAAGATVTAPSEVRIVFDGPLEPAFSSVTVTDAGGKQVNTAKAAVDAKDHDTISVALPSLPAGRYTVHWVAVASDGHRTHGDYGFDVK
ncbi:Protein YobA [Paraburkholderia piptadeniae]|uniref:Protein YobA n=1 Tax=Paraburkholderia piptadeniae TaxID=1701573 RepID=A0A1N7SWB9_9BURK|nr:copper resistance protein CopC [Paraburkholderia piptadeniae]SIT51675.1 Protein YobA [Paraburkholderia piptadeniae]